jgi:hypothetical protein
LEGAGGFSTMLGFWWHIRFPDEGVQQTLQFKTNNDNGILVSINIFEFVMVIFNYCAAFHVVWTSPATNNPHPVILNITNNSSALSWTLHMASNQKLGKCSLIFLFIVD